MTLQSWSRPSTLLKAGLAAGAAYGVARWLGVRSSARLDHARTPGAPRVLILGGGFGGITTAIELGSLAKNGLGVDVTLVDRVNFHLFTPMLYQVATGLLEPGNVTYPTRSIAREYGFGFRQGQVEGIDFGSREVLVSGARLPYDYLVIALGSTTNYFGIESVRQHASSLKTLGDAIDIRNRVLDAFERAEAESDPAERRALLTFVVVGGGATGVELTGSLHSLIHYGLLPDYPGIRPDEVRTVLVEAGPALLNGMDPWLGETAERRLVEKGIEVRRGNSATELSAEGIRFKDGSFLPSRVVVWAAGVRPSPLTAALSVEKGRDGRLVVDRYLRVPSHPEVFALGDCASFAVPELDGRPAPPNAQTAVRQAPVVARNIAASLRGEPLEPFEYKNEGNLVSLGQGSGVALIGTTRLDGLPAWLVWRGYYLSQLMGFKNRLSVLVEWTSAYFGQRATARLDTTTTPRAAAPSASSSASTTPKPPARAARRTRGGADRAPAAETPAVEPAAPIPPGDNEPAGNQPAGEVASGNAPTAGEPAGGQPVSARARTSRAGSRSDDGTV